MFKKTFLFATVLVLAGVFFVQLKGTLAPIKPAQTELPQQSQVLGLSDSPLYIPRDYKNLGSPFSVLPMTDGSLWFYDIMKYRLVKISPEGEVVRTIGRYGTDVGELAGQVDSMAADNDGNIYFAGRCLAYKLDSNGGEVKRWNICDGMTDGYAGSLSPRIAYNPVSNRIYVLRNHGVNPVSHTQSTPDLGSVTEYTTDGVFVSEMALHEQVREFQNIRGEDIGQRLYRPNYIRTGPDGKIYIYFHLEAYPITDQGSENPEIMSIVQIYSSNKAFVSEFDATKDYYHYDFSVLSSGKVATIRGQAPYVNMFNTAGNLESTWGEYGTNAWQMVDPRLAAGDNSGNIWIADGGLNSVQKYSSTGVFLSAIRNNGTVDSRLTWPTGVGFDSTGNAYILDNGEIDPRIQKFSSNGTYLSTIVPFSSTALTDHSYYLKIFNDKIYVSDKNKVTVFDLSGNVLDVIGSAGTGDGQFNFPRGMGIDTTGNLYVADGGNHRIQKFDTNGDYVAQWGSSGTNDNQLMYPSAVYVDSSNNVFVAESGNTFNGLSQPFDNYDNNGESQSPISRIKVFDSSGTYIRKFNAGTSTETINDMALNHSGQLEFTMYGFPNSIFVYELDGTPASSYGGYGSGVEEFASGASGIAMNPSTNFMTIADTYNHRVQLLPSGTRIYNLISSADVVQNNSTSSLVREYYNPTAPGVNSISSSMYFGDYIVSDFSVNLTQKRDWESVSVVTLPEESKSLVANLNPTGAPGISATHSLFVVKQPGQTSVRVCPTATQVPDINPTCSGGYTLQVGNAALSTVTIGDIEYWKVTGLTGTGIMALTTSVPTPTPTTTTTGTPTVSITPTATVKVTPTIKTTPVVRIPVVTLTAAVGGVTSPLCPVFDSFTVSSTIVKKGEKVTFAWQARNTETVTTKYMTNALSPVDTFEVSLNQTEELSFVADNGFCNAKKTVMISVVDTLPWNNTATVGTGLLLVEAAIALQQPMLFGNLWLGLLSLFDKKKKRSWGFVYDSQTKKAISRAVIRLVTFDGRTVDTVVSEANGTFKLAPRVGEFTLTVTHPAYEFPSKTIVGDTDQGYSNIYLGGKIQSKSSTEGIILSIPLDAKVLTEAQKSKLRLNKILLNTLTYGALALMMGGFLYSMYIAYVFPHWLNNLIVAFYALIVGSKIVFSLQPQKTFGKVVDVLGKPLSGVELGLFDPEFNTLQYRTFSTNAGEYSFLVPNANYVFKIMDKRYFVRVNNKKVQEFTLSKLPGKVIVRVINQKLVLEL